MDEYLKLQLHNLMISSVGYVLVKHYDFDLYDIDRFLQLYSKEMNMNIQVNDAWRQSFYMWKQEIQNNPKV